MQVTVTDLVVEYTSGGYAVRPLDGFSMEAERGELVLLLGASGCGKTTLLSVLAGILEPTSGSVVVDGVDVRALDRAGLTRYRRSTVGIVFQAFNLVASLSALENVQVPLRLAGLRGPSMHRRAAELIDQVGLADRAHHKPGDLSGGQQQRVAIARALSHDPAVIFADEPTAHLDYLQVEGVIRLLRDLADAGRTVVVSTHDDRLLPLADRVIELTPRFSGTEVERRHLELEPGDLLFEQGDTSDYVYVVAAGQLGVYLELADHSEEQVAVVDAGQHVGELGPLLGLQRSATVRATTASTVTAYTAAEFRARVQGVPKAAAPRRRATARKRAAKQPAPKRATRKAPPRRPRTS